MALSTKFELELSAISGGFCKECGRTVPAGAIPPRRGICYECCLLQDGKATTEGHHVFGRCNPAVVEIPGNLHRAINRRQEARRSILKRHIEDPLLGSAQLFTIIAELMEAGAEYARCLGLPNWVSELAEFIAGACRNAAERQLSIHAQVAEQLGLDWYKKVILP